MARKGAGAPPPRDLDERAEDLMDWIRLHSRAVALGVVVVVAIGAGAWLYMRTQSIRQERAATTLAGAQEALAVGNVALAQADLERVLNRYDGTRAARQAAVLLAQVQYEAGRYQEGLGVLERAAAGAPDYIAAQIEGLRAAGYEQLDQPAQAVQHYEAAAGRARFDTERASFRASAARIYAQMGDTQRAIAIWRELAEDPRGPMAPEARLRLGELQAVPAADVAG